MASTAALNAVENKIPDVTTLVKKADYNEKIKDVESKYFTPSDYNKFANNILDAKIKIKEIVNESDISEFIKSADLNENIKTLATKAELKAEQDKIVKLQTYH